MNTVSTLGPGQLAQRLAGPGLFLRTGPFVACIRSGIAQVADGVSLLYADHALADSDFADFHVQLSRSGGLRRYLQPQVRFDHDGFAPFEPLPLNQAYPMLEWVLNWCVSTRAHRYLIIHAAVVERNGCAVIMPAPPGSGKSTLCAALVSRGWRLLSDEMALISLDEHRLVPVPRPVSLKNASIDLIRAYAPGAVFSPAVSDTSKGTVAHMKPAPDSVRRAAETARPAWVVFPRYQAGAGATLEPIPSARAFMRVAENAFNYSLLGAAGFAALADVIAQSASFDFSYSVLDEAIEVFARLERPA
jgi:HprK-related kinase A